MAENPTPIAPSRTALLLMDIQPGALAYVAEPDAFLARANDALAWARKNAVHVCFVRVAFTENDYATIPAHAKPFAPVAQHKIFGADSPETQIHPALDIRDEDIVVRKTRIGAFSTTDLHAELDKRGVDTLLLAGISTSGVVLSTLRHAADADFRVHVLTDVTADPDPEVHRVLTEKIFPVQADVITIADLDRLTV